MKTARIAAALIAAVVVASSPSIAAAQEKIELKQKYTPGTYLATTTMSIDQTISMNDAAQPAQHIEQLMAMKMQVAEADAQGNKKVTITYERFKQEIKAAGQTLSYDSAKSADEQDPMMASMLSIFKKAKVEMTLDRDNNVTEVSGLDKLWDDMAEENAQMKPMLQKMKGQLGDAMIKDMVKQNQAMLPSGPVAVGDKWKNELEQEVPLAGKLKINLDCTLDSISIESGTKTASISWAGTLKTEKPQDADATGMPMSIRQITVKQSGTSKFDIETGMLGTTKLNQTGDFDVTLTSPEGQTMPMKISQKAKIVSKVVKYAAPE